MKTHEVLSVKFVALLHIFVPVSEQLWLKHKNQDVYSYI